MKYKLYDINGELVILEDLQDKTPWFELGESSEKVFIDKYGSQLNLIINPDKLWDKYTVDLKNIKTQNLGDLKTQHTPFFQAFDRYSIDPQFAVTFNKKDYLRYLEFYPGIEIYFWVDWVVTRFEGKTVIEVSPMEGVWKIYLEDINRLIDKSPLHYYQQRKFDFNSNSKGSYILDLSNPLFKKVI